MNILGINANGIRTKRKRLMLHRLLRELKVGVGVITETHMRHRELRGLTFPDYYIGNEYCRSTPLGERIGGGVLILVNRGIVAEAITEVSDLTPIVERCAIRLFPTEDHDTEMRVTGVYITPANTGNLTPQILEEVGATMKGRSTGEEAPHLIVGDLNTRSWEQMYAEWLGTQGLQELVDPDIPTFALGSSIDKILFLPGFYIPSSFLPQGGSRLRDRAEPWEAQYYPAEVVDYPMFSDHSPIMVPLSSDAKTRRGDDARRFRVGDLTEQDWEDRETEMSGLLAQRLPEGITGCEREFNAGHFYNTLE